MNEINLPPLPATKRGFMGLDGRDPLPVYTADEFRAGQIAAVEKDRAERGGVPVDRVTECARRLVDHADFRLAGCLNRDSKSKDIPSNAVSSVKARHLADLRDALAAAPQPQPVQTGKRCEPCRSTGLVHCANPDECGGPWTEPTTQPVQREPLTEESICDILGKGNPDSDEVRLIRLGYDYAHGITKKG